MFKKHFVVVTTHGGQEVRILQSDLSLNTWTRKDGGVTVRLDHSRTVRFDAKSNPVVDQRS